MAAGALQARPGGASLAALDRAGMGLPKPAVLGWPGAWVWLAVKAYARGRCRRFGATTRSKPTVHDR
eukprot:1005219-Alexandrium_andersonii.AAC.1